MTKKALFTIFSIAVIFIGCGKDEAQNEEPTYNFPVPEFYEFYRNSESTVDLTEPAIHIEMCDELLNILYVTDDEFGYPTLQEVLDRRCAWFVGYEDGNFRADFS